MSVLIVAREDDVHTAAVVQHIEKAGAEHVVADLSEFPQSSRLDVRYSCCGERELTLTLGGRRHDLADFGSAWWRRPQQPLISSDITSDTHRMFAANESAEALAGLWYALETFWVNDPATDHVAHRKITQLGVAQDVGLKLPDTLIKNDPDEARRYIDSRGYRNVIYKAFSALEQAWRETRILREEELDLVDYVKYAPVIFQEYIEAAVDLRITIVGEDVFPAAIHSQATTYPTDFRMDMARARIEPAILPKDVEVRLHDFMARLGLRYGAIDMRLQPDGTYVFLEVNPAGQWLFIEEATGQPISESLARLLVKNDGVAGDPLRS
ncbi:MAG: MvdC/MvdD family ATP grasp protein [Chloroflexota bacterium]